MPPPRPRSTPSAKAPSTTRSPQKPWRRWSGRDAIPLPAIPISASAGAAPRRTRTAVARWRAQRIRCSSSSARLVRATPPPLMRCAVATRSTAALDELAEASNAVIEAVCATVKAGTMAADAAAAGYEGARAGPAQDPLAPHLRLSGRPRLSPDLARLPGFFSSTSATTARWKPGWSSTCRPSCESSAGTAPVSARRSWSPRPDASA